MNSLDHDRFAKLEKIKELGFSAYGDDRHKDSAVRIRNIDVAVAIDFIETPSRDSGRLTECIGRIVLRREMGNLHFLTIRDQSGDVQIALSKKFLDEKLWALAQLLDLGDILSFHGFLDKTNKGEPTLWVHDFVFLSKSLSVPPSKYDGLHDIESRYRNRYIDLWSNPEVKDVFILRSKIISAIRTFLISKDFLEVETPMLHPIMGGAVAEPFSTYHNALNTSLFLRIAPELYLKKLLVGGLEKVFEIGKNFRNEGVSTKHNPEFTALEIYWSNSSKDDMRQLVQEMLEFVVTHCEHQKGFVNPFEDGFTLTSLPSLVEQFGRVDDLSDEAMFDNHIEKTLMNPTFVSEIPASKVPLAKSQNGSSLSYELIVKGMELGCIYQEENDPEQQLSVLMDQAQGDTKKIDWNFIDALRSGLPRSSGFGLGIDRLVMLFTGQSSIKDVILFPAMKEHHD